MVPMDGGDAWAEPEGMGEPSDVELPNETYKITVAVMSLPVAPRRALTRHTTLRGPAQQGLRRDPDEGGRFAGPIPPARERA